MEKIEKLLIFVAIILAWISIALSSFGTQDQQIGGQGGFDPESCKHMIFFGYLTTGILCAIAGHYLKDQRFYVGGAAIVVGGGLWTYVVPHPIFKARV